MTVPVAARIVVGPTVVAPGWQAMIATAFGRVVRRFRALLGATPLGVWPG